ncbi:MAG: DUF5058 family protein [Oscillospiraceae bacterium]|nr:DUF5058 family protein [Oscillospiraceae bacterium]
MTIQEKLNSPAMYLITGAIVLFVAGLCVVFMIRAWKAGQAIGMDRKLLRKTITASATFSVLPSTAILLGVIALSGTLGIPLPWLRLSVVGALHYEASVADIAARGAGMNGLNASELTLEAFTSIAFVMTVGIIWGMVLMLTLGKTYCNRITRSNKKTKGGRSFADVAMTAMFVGLISAYLGSYIAQMVQVKGGGLVFTGNILPLVTAGFSALAMAGMNYLAVKKKQGWVENFSIAGSMLIGMTAAVLCGMAVSA